MKLFLVLLCPMFLTATANSQQKETKQPQPDSTRKMQTVEAACGECQFGLDGNSCDLAIRIEGKSYFVDGTSIDAHGDAHASDGFCKMIRKAEVQGAVVGNRFKVSYFKLLPVPAPK